MHKIGFRLALLASLSLALTLAACGEPPPPEDTTVHISGTIIRDDDSPAFGQAVQIIREGSTIAEVNTDPNGKYTFIADESELTGALSLRCQLDGHADTPALGLDFTVSGKTMNMPTLRFMEANLSEDYDATDMTVAVPNYADGDGGRPASYELQVLDQDFELILQPATNNASSVKIPRLLLEDFSINYNLSAILNLSGMTGFARSSVKEVAPVNPAPLSRNTGCEYSSTVEQTPSALSPCPITDGDVTTKIEKEAICIDLDPNDAISECASTFERLVVDLGASATIRHIVLHELNARELGQGSQLVMERSDDGATFTPITGLETTRTVLDLPAPINARYLRLSYTGTDTDSALNGFNEVSVY